MLGSTSCGAIGVVDFDRRKGLVQHAGFRGRATVEPFDSGRAWRLLTRYLGPDERGWDKRFSETFTDASNVLLRFEADTVVARDVSYTWCIAD